MLVNNKYKYWYLRLILGASRRSIPDGYVEKHHMIPRFLGGGDSKENLVSLTFREHFVAHWLLTKCTEGHVFYKACHALVSMGRHSPGRRVTSWQYARARKAACDYRHSAEIKAKISAAHSGKILSEEYRSKISQTLFGRKLGPHSEAHKKAISIANKGKKRTTQQNENNRKAQILRAATTGMFDLNSVPKRFCSRCGNWFSAGMFVRWHGTQCRGEFIPSYYKEFIPNYLGFGV